MAVVGVVLLDIYLLEAVLYRVRTRDARAAALLPPGAHMRHYSTAAIGAAVAEQAAAVRAAAAASLMATAHSGSGKLMVLKELTQNALAIVPRGASSPAQQAAFVGDDPAAAAAAAAAKAPLGLSTGVGNRKHAPATLKLLDGLLPSRRQQALVREQREWQQLRQRYKSLELNKQTLGGLRDGGRGGSGGGGALLPPELRLPQTVALPRLRPPAAANTTAAHSGGRQGALLQGPLPFVGLRGYVEASDQPRGDGVVPSGACCRFAVGGLGEGSAAVCVFQTLGCMIQILGCKAPTPHCEPQPQPNIITTQSNRIHHRL